MASNKVCGTIVVQETGIGIPGLLVVVYDVDPSTKPEEEIYPPASGNQPVRLPELLSLGDRLGSVATDQNGVFELIYEDEDFRYRNPDEKRPDIWLFVMTPERATGELSTRVLYQPQTIRQSAGRIETYRIEISATKLEEAKIAIPQAISQDTENPTLLLARLGSALQRQDQIQSGVSKLRAGRIDAERQRVKEIETKFQTFVQAISTVPTNPTKASSYVKPGESVEVTNQQVIAIGIRQQINKPEKRAPIRGHIFLTDEQKQSLAPYQNVEGTSYDNVPEAFVKSNLIGKVPRQQVTSLIRENPLTQLCRQKIEDERRARRYLNLPDENHSEDGSNHLSDLPSDNTRNPDTRAIEIEPATPDDIPKYVAKLMGSVMSPEEPVALGVTRRADQGAIQDAVEKLKLTSGPANAPAFHDFHHLQIAFEHVWQEAIDQGILDIGMDLYEQIVELGGDPTTRAEGQDPLEALRLEAINVANAASELDAIEPVVRRDHRNGRKDIGRARRGNERFSDFLEGLERLTLGVNTPWKNSDERPSERVPARHGGILGLLAELDARLKEPYAFTVYAANRQQRSINFGTLVTYRQEWTPTSYQAGDLVKTIPLAAKQSVRWTAKTTQKKRIAQKAVENSLSSRKEESSETSRAEQEIFRKAETKTNFNLTSTGTLSGGLEGIGTASTTQTVVIGGDVSKISQDVKKDFREAVFKAAQEYRQEHTLEINTEESGEFEIQESGEISNPNNELSVTYLFYELQQRFRIVERLQGVKSVVLVALEVPNPAEIDEDWLIAHAWILRRVLLDDSFLPALTYVSTRLIGDERALVELQKNLEQQRTLVDELKIEFGSLRRQVSKRYLALERAIAQQAGIVGDEQSFLEAAAGVVVPTLAVDKVADLFGFGGSSQGDQEAARIRREAAEAAYERTLREERDLRSRLDREITALNEMTETYAKALSNHLNQQLQVCALKIHIKMYILYYMQAIWSHLDPDQLFFSLHNATVPVLEGSTTYSIDIFPSDTNLKYLAAKQYGLQGTMHGFEVHPNLFAPPADGKTKFEKVKSLVEVADLDNLLGFKGNYAIFPLKQSNALTDFMMAPYIDNALGTLIDPDELGNWTLEEFSKYVCCLKETLPPEEFNEELKEQLRQQYKRLLTSPLRNTEEIIVPTGSLFIEALPGEHTMMENFMLEHRAIDVDKVQAEVRGMELENIRMAARLLAEEYEDPDIDKKIIVEGGLIPTGEL